MTLWHGERQTITAHHRHADLHGATTVVSVTGWNLTTQPVPAASVP